MTAFDARLFALTVTAALLALTVRQQRPELAQLISLAACVLGGAVLVGWFAPVLRLLRTLSRTAGLDDSLVEPMGKVLGIGMLTQLSASVCTDAGQSALARLTELGGSLLCLVLALPLVEAVVVLLEGLL